MSETLHKMIVGKFKGMNIEDIPDSYLEWISDEAWFKAGYPQLYENIIFELEERDKFDLHK